MVRLAYMSRSQFNCDKSQSKSSNRAGNWWQELWQELRQGPWRGATQWFAPHGMFSLLSFLTESRTTNPGMAPLTVGWALSFPSLFWKMIYMLASAWSYGVVSSSQMTLVSSQHKSRGPFITPTALNVVFFMCLTQRLKISHTWFTWKVSETTQQLQFLWEHKATNLSQTAGVGRWRPSKLHYFLTPRNTYQLLIFLRF